MSFIGASEARSTAEKYHETLLESSRKKMDKLIRSSCERGLFSTKDIVEDYTEQEHSLLCSLRYEDRIKLIKELHQGGFKLIRSKNRDFWTVTW